MGCKMRGYVVCLAFSMLLHSGLTGKLPSTIQTCKLSDPNLDNCLRAAITDSLPKLKQGIPDLNVSPLDPLEVPGMTIGEGEGAVHVVQNFKNIKIIGATESNLTKVDGSRLKQYRLYSESFTPSLRLEARYSLNGRILLIPIQGEGDCIVNLENLRATHTIIGEKQERKGKIYMKVIQYIITLHPAKVEFSFKNLFNGDERLGKEMNNLLNENWKEVFEDVKEGYEESIGLIFGDFSNKVFSRIPFQDIFLE